MQLIIHSLRKICKTYLRGMATNYLNMFLGTLSLVSDEYVDIGLTWIKCGRKWHWSSNSESDQMSSEFLEKPKLKCNVTYM